MDTEHLHWFVEVVRRGSFAAVARARDVDPSSVSRAIRALESELGFSLFDRTTRTLAPTEAGAMYFQQIEALIEDLAHAGEQASGHANTPHGNLRVLAPVSFSLLNIVPLLPQFLSAFPGIRVDLQLNDALLDLVENRVDLAIRLGPLRDSSLIARRLAPMRAHVCASPTYLERHGTPTTPTDLARHTCLVLNMPGFGHRWRFRDHAGQVSHVDVDARVTTSNALALEQLALAGEGIVLQAEWIVGPAISSGRLVDLFPHHAVTASLFDNAIWSVRPARRHEPTKVRAFLEFLHHTFETTPPWRADPLA